MCWFGLKNIVYLLANEHIFTTDFPSSIKGIAPDRAGRGGKIKDRERNESPLGEADRSSGLRPPIKGTAPCLPPECMIQGSRIGIVKKVFLVVYREPSRLIRPMRVGRRRSGEGAPRYPTLATRPRSGGGISGAGPRKGGLAGTRGCAGRRTAPR